MTSDGAPTTVFLHGGMHKTGSSSIQRYLLDNRQFLEDSGYRVVDDVVTGLVTGKRGGISTNCYGLADLLLREYFATPIRLRHAGPVPTSADRDERVTAVNQILRTFAGSKNLIISAEAFSFLKSADEKRRYDDLFRGLHVQPILFLRERQSWISSWSKQTAKLRAKLERKELLIGDDLKGYRENIFDLGPNSVVGLESAIRDFFGPDGLYLSYEEVMKRQGSTVPAFLGAIGLEPADCPNHDAYWSNRTRTNQPTS